MKSMQTCKLRLLVSETHVKLASEKRQRGALLHDSRNFRFCFALANFFAYFSFPCVNYFIIVDEVKSIEQRE